MMEWNQGELCGYLTNIKGINPMSCSVRWRIFVQWNPIVRPDVPRQDWPPRKVNVPTYELQLLGLFPLDICSCDAKKKLEEIG